MTRYYDLLVYSDTSDSFETEIAVGDDAGKLGFDGKWIVAKGPPIHEGKDATVVVAGGGPSPMVDLQAVLNRLDDERRGGA